MHFRRARILRLAGIAAALAGLFLATGVRQIDAQAATPVVKASLLLSTDQVRPGAATLAAVVARITPGFHINDHHPSLDYLIPTNLKIEDGKIFSVERVSYPRGKIEKFVFSETGLSVYEGQIVIGALLKVAPQTPPGEYALKGMLEYQACNDHACLPPASVPLMMNVKVAGRGAAIHHINSDVFRKIRAG